MVQINKYTNKKNQVIRRNPSLVKNIIRKNRFHTTYTNSNFKGEFIKQDEVDNDDLKSFLVYSFKEKTKKINKIYCKVFPEFRCELEIGEQLSFFEDGTSIELKLEEIKYILIQ